MADTSGQLALIRSRYVARLQGTIIGKNDLTRYRADALAYAGEVLDLVPPWVLAPGQLALHRIYARRGDALPTAFAPEPGPQHRHHYAKLSVG